MGNMYNMSYDDLVVSLTNDARKQREDEINKMRALALNGRPDGAAGVSVAGGSLINAGGEVARQMAYDRNMAAVNNPGALLEMLKGGKADVGGPRARRVLHDRDRLAEDSANMDLEQLETDLDQGHAPEMKNIADASMAANKRSRSGAFAEGILERGIRARNDRVRLLAEPLPEETQQYKVPTFETPEEPQRYGGDVRPIKPQTMKISRDKKSLIPYFTNL